MSYSVAVAGASGYAGGELLRILADHPSFEIRTVTAGSNAGSPLIDHHPHLRSLAHLTLQETDATTLAGHDVVFLVDCGADHRLTSESDWNAFYGGDYAGAWAYGVPELPTPDGKQRDALAGVNRIATPGCN